MIQEASREEAPEFGEAYQGARKAYGLVSALLIAWELIGMEFSPSPIENLNITLKSPQAIPYVLIVLVAYFAFRFTVEWYQADSRRRSKLVSRIDFGAGHLIGILALVLYSYQTLREIQLATKISPQRFTGLLAGAFIGLFMVKLLAQGAFWRTWRTDRVLVVLIGFQYLSLGLLTYWTLEAAPTQYLLVGLTVGSLAWSFWWFLRKRLARQPSQAKEENR
jgi:hypothetical protein